MVYLLVLYGWVRKRHIFECAKSSLGARLVTAKSLNEMFVLKECFPMAKLCVFAVLRAYLQREGDSYVVRGAGCWRARACRY